MNDPQHATLVRWYRSEGDVVCLGERICEIATENATVDIESPNDGVLRQLGKVGDRINAGTDFARIDPIH